MVTETCEGCQCKAECIERKICLADFIRRAFVNIETEENGDGEDLAEDADNPIRETPFGVLDNFQ